VASPCLNRVITLHIQKTTALLSNCLDRQTNQYQHLQPHCNCPMFVRQRCRRDGHVAITPWFKAYIKLGYIFKVPLTTVRASTSMQRWCSSVSSFVCLSPKCIPKKQFSQELSKIELWFLKTTNRKSYMSFSKNPLLGHLPSWKSLNRHISTTSMNLVHKCRFGTWWQSCNKIWKFSKFNMAEDRHTENRFFWP